MKQRSLRAACCVLTVLSIVLIAGCASSGAGSAPAAPAAPPPPPAPVAVGSWNLTIETPQGTQEPTLVVSGTEGNLSGMFSSPQGELALDSISADGDKLMFSLKIDAGGQELQLDFEGMIDGDNLSGTLNSAFGGMTTTGTRAP